jgi:hypothetical protein
MGDQAPPDQIERALAGLVVLADDQQFLARRAIVTRADVPNRLSLTFSPSTMAKPSGSELWIIRPHMPSKIEWAPDECQLRIVLSVRD